MSATTERLRPPSRTLMFLEGRAIRELGGYPRVSNHGAGVS
jgi:hypothetical protein